jgi:hypothetical protein
VHSHRQVRRAPAAARRLAALSPNKPLHQVNRPTAKRQPHRRLCLPYQRAKVRQQRRQKACHPAKRCQATNPCRQTRAIRQCPSRPTLL